MESGSDKTLVRELLANERTFLAWFRTAIGVMAFGFVVVKFSLFVKQIALGLGTETHIQQKGYSAIIGIALVILGALICIFSYIRYRYNVVQIRKLDFKYTTTFLTLLAGFVFAISIVLVVYLIKTT